MGLYDSLPVSVNTLATIEEGSLTDPFETMKKDTLHLRNSTRSSGHLNKEKIFGNSQRIRLPSPNSTRRYADARMEPPNEIHPTLPAHIKLQHDEFKMKHRAQDPSYTGMKTYKLEEKE